ncbi:glycosyltransferase [Streptomyces sp. NPDC086023]|uniref:glycosyltransferase n=1 Tax=Streptomyces sp. NPDC086023 TaxID=3365746 RepID=UPI0037D4FE23
MAPETGRARILLVTDGPATETADGGGELALGIAGCLPEPEFTCFTRWPEHRGGRRPSVDRTLPVLVRGGAPSGAPQRLQTAVASALFSRRFDALHVVMSVGSSFPAFSRWWARAVAGTPVVHTVPGITDPAALAGARPLGRTVAVCGATAAELAAAGFGEVVVIPPVVPSAVPPGPWRLKPRELGPVPVALVVESGDGDGGLQDAVSAVAAASAAGAVRLVVLLRARPGRRAAAREAAVRRHAVRQGLLDTVVCSGITDVDRLLGIADALLFLPRDGAGGVDCPSVVLQALAVGRPVVLTGLPRFAGLRGAVLSVTPGDPDRAGQVLRELLDRPWWWESVAGQGKELAGELFSGEVARARYERLYRAVGVWAQEVPRRP